MYYTRNIYYTVGGVLCRDKYWILPQQTSLPVEFLELLKIPTSFWQGAFYKQTKACPLRTIRGPMPFSYFQLSVALVSRYLQDLAVTLSFPRMSCFDVWSISTCQRNIATGRHRSPQVDFCPSLPGGKAAEINASTKMSGRGAWTQETATEHPKRLPTSNHIKSYQIISNHRVFLYYIHLYTVFHFHSILMIFHAFAQQGRSCWHFIRRLTTMLLLAIDTVTSTCWHLVHLVLK